MTLKFLTAAVLLSIVAATPDWILSVGTGGTTNWTEAFVNLAGGSATVGSQFKLTLPTPFVTYDGTNNYAMGWGFGTVVNQTTQMPTAVYVYLTGCINGTTGGIWCGAWGLNAMAQPALPWTTLLTIPNSQFHAAYNNVTSIVRVLQGKLLVQPLPASSSYVYISTVCALSGLSNLATDSAWTNSSSWASKYQPYNVLFAYTPFTTLFVDEGANFGVYIGDVNSATNTEYQVTDNLLLNAVNPLTTQTLVNQQTHQSLYVGMGRSSTNTNATLVQPLAATSTLTCSNPQLTNFGAVQTFPLNNPIAIDSAVWNLNAGQPNQLYAVGIDGSVWSWNASNFQAGPTYIYNNTASGSIVNSSLVPAADFVASTSAAGSFWYRSNTGIVTYSVTNSQLTGPVLYVAGPTGLAAIDGYSNYVVWYNATSGQMWQQNYNQNWGGASTYGMLYDNTVGAQMIDEVQPFAAFNQNFLLYEIPMGVNTTCDGTNACVAPTPSPPSPTAPTAPSAGGTPVAPTAPTPVAPTAPASTNTIVAAVITVSNLTPAAVANITSIINGAGSGATNIITQFIQQYNSWLTQGGLTGTSYTIPCSITFIDTTGHSSTINIPSSYTTTALTGNVYGATSSVCSAAPHSSALRFNTLQAANSGTIEFYTVVIASTTASVSPSAAVSSSAATNFLGTTGFLTAISTSLTTNVPAAATTFTASSASPYSSVVPAPSPPATPSSSPKSSANTVSFAILLFAAVQLVLMYVQ